MSEIAKEGTGTFCAGFEDGVGGYRRIVLENRLSSWNTVRRLGVAGIQFFIYENYI